MVGLTIESVFTDQMTPLPGRLDELVRKSTFDVANCRVWDYGTAASLRQTTTMAAYFPSQPTACEYHVCARYLTHSTPQGIVPLASRGFLFLGRPPTYGKTTLSRPNLFREQDYIEGIHLRLREVVVPMSLDLPSDIAR